ncbi:MAG: radical SAM protein [Promethearchaeota archaeon]
MSFKKIYCFITNKCNNRCILCLHSKEMKRSIKEINLNELKQLLSSIDINPDDLFSVSGGEPTLHSALPSILKFLKEEYGNLVQLVTNARKLVEDSFLESIAPFIDYISTSLFGMSSKTHDYTTRRRNSFTETILGLQNAEKFNLKLNLRYVPTKYNYEEIPELVYFILDNFTNPHIVINALQIISNAKLNQDKLAIQHSRIVPLISQAIDDADSKKIMISVHFPICIFDPYYWNHFSTNFKTVFRNSYVIMKGKTYKIGQEHQNFQPKACQDCLFQTRCIMLSMGYVNLFGEGEITPIKQAVSLK